MASASSNPPADFGEVVWRGDCCIDSAAERHEELLRALETGLPVRIDAREVSRLDTVGLQLLVSFSLELTRRGRTLSWLGASEPVAQAAALAGLTRMLGLPH